MNPNHQLPKADEHLSLASLRHCLKYTTSGKGVAQLDATASGQMGSRALAYYFGTTICAAITGIMCVVTIHPGSPTLLKHTMEETPAILKEGSKVTTMDAFLDIVRYTDIVKEGELWL